MEIKNIDINKLKPHPQNNKFYDIPEGEEQKNFTNDIKLHGIRTPLTINAKTFRIIKGHRRWYAGLELKLQKVPCILKNYTNEYEELTDLIADNDQHRQTDNPYKKLIRVGAVYVEAKKCSKQGSNQYASVHSGQKHSPRDETCIKTGVSKHFINTTIQFLKLSETEKQGLKKWIKDKFVTDKKYPTDKSIHDGIQRIFNNGWPPPKKPKTALLIKKVTKKKKKLKNGLDLKLQRTSKYLNLKIESIKALKKSEVSKNKKIIKELANLRTKARLLLEVVKEKL